MQVELREHVGQSVGRSSRTITLPQYRVYVDGVASGIIGWKEGAPLNMHRRFGPIELQEIAEAVGMLLKSDTPAVSQPPELPTDPEPETESSIIVNDFLDT